MTDNDRPRPATSVTKRGKLGRGGSRASGNIRSYSSDAEEENSRTQRLRTVAELAAAAQRHPKTIRRAIKSRRIRAVRMNREYRIPDHEYERVLREGF